MSARVWVGLALAVWFPLYFACTSARAGSRHGATDRAGVLANFAAAAVAVVAAYALVPWQVVPAGLWGALVAATVFGVVAAAAAWARLPGLAGKHPRWRAVSTSSTVAIGAAVVAVFVSA
jgi:hypothetical protein